MPKGLARTNVLDLIREDLDSYVGKQVIVRANRGRRKVDEVEGILEHTYPRLFVVTPLDRTPFKRHSYTYCDVLTSSVEVMHNGARIGYTK
ncbi:MAG: Veg family protein [Bacillota bacterium]|nr:Veg family protein [Bacillota bacterium]